MAAFHTMAHLDLAVDCRDQPHPRTTGKDGSGSVSGRIPAGFGSCGFGDGFSPTVFGFGFGFGFSPVDIQWISEINHLKLKLMFYNMLIITCLLILLNLFKIDS
jgi:hypothetical protein